MVTGEATVANAIKEEVTFALSINIWLIIKVEVKVMHFSSANIS